MLPGSGTAVAVPKMIDVPFTAVDVNGSVGKKSVEVVPLFKKQLIPGMQRAPGGRCDSTVTDQPLCPHQTK